VCNRSRRWWPRGVCREALVSFCAADRRGWLDCGPIFSLVLYSPFSSTPRRHSIMSTLEYFWHLSAANKTTRLDASEQLVSALEKFQAAHEVPTPAPGADTAENLDRVNAPDVAYAIKRLVRGLASPRESSRLGFSVALTEVRITYIDNLWLWLMCAGRVASLKARNSHCSSDGSTHSRRKRVQ